MSVEGHQSLSPIELDHHEAVEIGVVLCAGQVVVGLDVGVCGGLGAGEEVVHLGGRVVVDVSEGLDVRQPLHVAAVVLKPNSSMEGHLVVLLRKRDTISSMALESFEKMSLNALSRSYSLEARSS